MAKEKQPKEQTLFCKIGRAAPQALATASDDAAGTASLDAVEAAKVSDLIRGGVALNRVEFTRETNKGE